MPCFEHVATPPDRRGKQTERDVLPDSIARWRRGAIYDDVADFAFGMTPDDVYDAVFMHGHSVLEA
jgi:hypothetical protein